MRSVAANNSRLQKLFFDNESCEIPLGNPKVKSVFLIIVQGGVNCIFELVWREQLN